MFTAHGSASASGARTAVCPAPVRRALLLLGLMAGALCALWLAGAAPAGAAEGPGADLAVPARALDHNAVADLGTPLADTVATVGTGVDRARQALEEPAAAQAPAAPEDVARHLDEAVRQVVTAPVAETAPLPGFSGLPEITLPEPVPGVERPGEDAPRPQDPAVADVPAEAAAFDAFDVAAADTVTAAPAAERRSAADTGTAAVTDTAVAPAPSAPGTTATAPAAPAGSAAQGGGLIAGYLPAPGAPTPAPGLLQAAWHVLRSVPAEPSDEPTFSPD
ncbi:MULTISPECIES: hypothetical protein [unclassified Nocardiopsis]|uniref:hypothetical protein n=1 Tax=Nocardiopsis TaxID=2013 RepID=UPI00387B0479